MTVPRASAAMTLATLSPSGGKLDADILAPGGFVCLSWFDVDCYSGSDLLKTLLFLLVKNKVVESNQVHLL